MIGNPDQPQDLSLAQTSLLCSPDPGDYGTALQVGLSDSLLNRHLQGERTVNVQTCRRSRDRSEEVHDCQVQCPVAVIHLV